MPSLIGQQLGSFKIDDQIGAGAMGVVYRATHQRTGKTAAVKVITFDQQGSKANSTDRFEREAEILQQFRHPGIVRFLAVGRYRGTNYFAMEYVQGQTLDTILEKREFLPWQEVVDIGVQLCDALQYAHQRGVVHRDLKPSNIMITGDGQVKLTDFGIAKDLDATALTATGRTLGTAAYMAPEQIRGTPAVSHKTDLYALGCLLYQMLASEPPFKGQAIAVLMNSHLNQDAPRPSSRVPDVPRALDDLVLNLMSKAPTDRPWDAEAVGDVLKKLQTKLERGEKVNMVFATGEAPPAVPSDVSLREGGPASSKPRKKKKKKKKGEKTGLSAPSLGSIALGLALLALLGFSIYMLQPPSAEQLYNKAQPLIESDDFVQWQDADRLYISELQERYPNHPYKKQVAALHDRMALHKARAWAKQLQKLAEPKNDIESLYLRTATAAAEAAKTGADDIAAQNWQTLAQNLQESYPSERGWILLAQENADASQAVMKRRRDEAVDLLGDAKAAEALNNFDLAYSLRHRVIDQYSQYHYLSDLIGSAWRGLPTPAPEPEPKTEPEPKPESQPEPPTDAPTPPDTPPAPTPTETDATP